jgi:hypothetical protein
MPSQDTFTCWLYDALEPRTLVGGGGGGGLGSAPTDALGWPVPTALVAVTLARYVRPVMTPPTGSCSPGVLEGSVHGPSALPFPVSTTHTVYDRMGLPPVTRGGSHPKVNDVLRCVLKAQAHAHE